MVDHLYLLERGQVVADGPAEPWAPTRASSRPISGHAGERRMNIAQQLVNGLVSAPPTPRRPGLDHPARRRAAGEFRPRTDLHARRVRYLVGHPELGLSYPPPFLAVIIGAASVPPCSPR